MFDLPHSRIFQVHMADDPWNKRSQSSRRQAEGPNVGQSNHLKWKVLDAHIDQIGNTDADARIKDLDPDQVALAIKIDHDALFYFFALRNLTLLEVHIERIRRLAVFDFHAPTCGRPSGSSRRTRGGSSGNS